MTDTVVNRLLQNVASYQNNPVAIQRAVLGVLEEVSNGAYPVVDPTNPFVFALETAAVCTAAAMMRTEVAARKQYPRLAQQETDLYYHMSDKDYADRFALPSKTTFAFALPKDEIINKMVLDPDTGNRKLVIPRHTFVTVADVVFSLQYPIEIRQLAHQGLQVVYDVEKTSPLQDLPTNAIAYQERNNGEMDWLYFEVEMQQFSMLSSSHSITTAADFKLDIALSDQFYYARVYTEDSNGLWQEIATTHSEQVYDPLVPTAVLRVIDGLVRVTIPQIYTNSKLLNKQVRIDVYQTKGPLEMLLGEYAVNAFTTTWISYDKNDSTVFSAPLKTLRSAAIYSDRALFGGRNALSFLQLRQRILKNATGGVDIPITNNQLESKLENQGYEVVKSIDHLTNRVFIATRDMPIPEDQRLITAAAASISSLTVDMASLALLPTVVDNGSAVTLSPNTIYRNINGVTSIVPATEIAALQALPAEQRALMITNGNFLYTPFHYVLDTANQEFDLRPYYLDAPEIATKLFVAENDTTLIQVATDAYGIERTANGYAITIVTSSDQAYKDLADEDVFVQLAFIPAGEKDRAYINGELIGYAEGGERIYRFEVSTTYHVDKNHAIYLDSFHMYSSDPMILPTALLTDMDVIYSTSVTLGSQWKANRVDQVLGRFLLPNRIAGLAHETLRVQFGEALTTLWARSRSMISAMPYETWAVDVPRVYEKDEFVRDGTTGSAITIDEDGHATFSYLHRAGDPVLDINGQPTYLHRKGDVKLDPDTGEPMVAGPRSMLRQIDLMLIEGPYWFATDATAVNYRRTMVGTVVDWLISDLQSLTPRLLDQTRIYYYPKTTQGSINVMIEEGITKTIAAGQAFRVTLYVSDTVHKNLELRERLEKVTVSTLSAVVGELVVSTDIITTALREQYGTDVIAFEVEGLGGEANLPALTVLDSANRCSIRKRLVALADDSLIVQEDVTCIFKRHEMK